MGVVTAVKMDVVTEKSGHHAQRIARAWLWLGARTRAGRRPSTSGLAATCNAGGIPYSAGSWRPCGKRTFSAVDRGSATCP
jgi:hypothetical protein